MVAKNGKDYFVVKGVAIMFLIGFAFSFLYFYEGGNSEKGIAKVEISLDNNHENVKMFRTEFSYYGSIANYKTKKLSFESESGNDNKLMCYIKCLEK